MLRKQLHLNFFCHFAFILFSYVFVMTASGGIYFYLKSIKFSVSSSVFFEHWKDTDISQVIFIPS